MRTFCILVIVACYVPLMGVLLWLFSAQVTEFIRP